MEGATSCEEAYSYRPFVVQELGVMNLYHKGMPLSDLTIHITILYFLSSLSSSSLSLDYFAKTYG